MKTLRKIAMLTVMVLVLGLFGGITTTAETTTLISAVEYDFDVDDRQTVADAMLLLRHIDGWDDGVFTDLEGDVSGDGVVNVYDAVCFLKVLLNSLNNGFDMTKSLKIATYNIKAGYYDTGKTLPYIAELLKEVNADIIGLQEVDHYTTRSMTYQDQLKYIAEYLETETGEDYYYQFVPAIVRGNSHEAADPTATENLYGHGIISKYPIKDYDVIHPTQQGTDAEYRVIGRYEIDVDGKTVAFYNSHLDFSVGRYQYKQIQNDYMSEDQYAIFVGDMNETIKELEDSNCINYDRYDILTEYQPDRSSDPIDHIIVSKDTISWYERTLNEKENVAGFTAISKEVETSFTYDGKTVTKASDHNLRYSYVMLKDA